MRRRSWKVPWQFHFLQSWRRRVGGGSVCARAEIRSGGCTEIPLHCALRISLICFGNLLKISPAWDVHKKQNIPDISRAFKRFHGFSTGPFSVPKPSYTGLGKKERRSGLILNGIIPRASKLGGCTMGISLEVPMVFPQILLPALVPK